ncbi:MAG: AbrB/MazE/SpoVT family DNA-binding domain-containing protein [Candidatus Xenobia bacterium]
MKVTRRGQVTIPKDIRLRTGIDEGTEVAFHEEGGKVIIVKAETENPFEDRVGYLKHPGDSDAVVRKMRGHFADLLLL